MPENPIHAIDVILHKRDGLVLTDGEINAFVRAVVDRTATDAQIASWLMAVFQRGLNPQELATLTTAMRFSGETFDSSFLNAFCIDKHSTGGVGDKTSLLIAPIVAAAGLKVPMISGRSLGHTGGTLDKLETIPGFRTQLSMAEFAEIIAKCGFFMAGQTPRLVPADRILYALRDHTGRSNPLTSSAPAS
jgi:thymidine phosphorylase